MHTCSSMHADIHSPTHLQSHLEKENMQSVWMKKPCYILITKQFLIITVQGDDSVIECVNDGVVVSVHNSYNDGRNNKRLSQEASSYFHTNI